MKDKKETPSHSPKSSGGIEIMQVKNTKALQYFEILLPPNLLILKIVSC